MQCALPELIFHHQALQRECCLKILKFTAFQKSSADENVDAGVLWLIGSRLLVVSCLVTQSTRKLLLDEGP